MRSECKWAGCDQAVLEHVGGVPYCRVHVIENLRQEVIEGVPHLQFDEKRRPSNSTWLNRFSRLAYFCDAPEGLTKGKIEQRSYAFDTPNMIVEFKIERHPVGRVLEQHWSFNGQTGEWRFLSESIVDTEYECDDNGNFLCPPCGATLELSPGRARCTDCDFEHLHEHSW